MVACRLLVGTALLAALSPQASSLKLLQPDHALQHSVPEIIKGVVSDGWLDVLSNAQEKAVDSGLINATIQLFEDTIPPLVSSMPGASIQQLADTSLLELQKSGLWDNLTKMALAVGHNISSN